MAEQIKKSMTKWKLAKEQDEERMEEQDEIV